MEIERGWREDDHNLLVERCKGRGLTLVGVKVCDVRETLLRKQA